MKRETYRRFAYIETCLYWGVGITARQLGKTFGITRQNAHAVIENYRRQHPENLVYNPSARRHKITDNFEAHYIYQQPGRYLNNLRGNHLTNQFWEDEEWTDLPVHDVDILFQHDLKSDQVSKVISAIQNKQTLQLRYHAKTETYELITVSPTELVYANRRYHVRAYCFEWKMFFDLVPTRILEAEFAPEDWVSSAEDKEWNNWIELYFVPNPKLPEQAQKTLLMDYRLDTGRYRIKTRAALKNYVLRELERPDWKHKIPLWLEDQ